MTSTPAPIRIRPAEAADREAVLAISAQIWDGEDYIPYVWDNWLRDPGGQLSVATLRGRVVGLAKLTQHAAPSDASPGEWWLEGIRVDPKYRGRGIARQLHDYHLALAARPGPGVMRFSTSSENQAMHHIGQETGFRHVGRFTRIEAPALSRADYRAAEEAGTLPPTLETWRVADLPDLEKFVRRASQKSASQSALASYGAGWGFHALTLSRLGGRVAARQALGWRGAGGSVCALALVAPDREARVLRVHFAEGRARGALSLSDLGYALRDSARRRRLARLTMQVPVGSAAHAALLRAGFVNRWPEGDEIWVFEKELSIYP